MPQSDVLEYFRQKDPRFKEMSDTELTSYIRSQHPDFAKELSGGKIPRTLMSEGQKKSETRIRNIKGEQIKEEYEQGQKDIKTKAWGQAAEMLPFAVAAPFTAGTSLAVGATIMGVAGLAGGLSREIVKAKGGSSDLPKSMSALALSLGIDTAMSAGGESFGRGIGEIGKTLIPKLIQRSAAKSEFGGRLLEELFSTIRNKLYGKIQEAGASEGKTLMVDVGEHIKKAYDALNKLPRGTGELAGRFTNMTAKTAEVVKAIEEDLALSGGSISNKQPLDALIRLKGSMQKMAWTEGTLAAEEKVVFKNLAENLDGVIKKELKTIGPDAEALYKKTNDLMIVQKQRDVSVSLAENLVKKFAGRMTAGAIIGGGMGYTTGGPGAAAKGAALGAGASVLTGDVLPRLSSWLLELTMNHPEGAIIFGRAIDAAIKGNKGKASFLALRAVVISGGRNKIKEAIKHTQMPDKFGPDTKELNLEISK